MPTETIDIREAESRLADLVALANSGTDIILTEGATPRARLVPLEQVKDARVPGLHPGAMQARDDFDEPLPDDFFRCQ
jgi:antitoxin (DNA-binding transcriptional repressor) of toxin-antitoxin stability system